MSSKIPPKGGRLGRTFDDEQEGTGVSKDVRASNERGAEVEGGGGDPGEKLSAVPEKIQAVQEGGGQGAGTRGTWQALKQAYGAGDKGENNRSIQREIYGIRSDAGGRKAEQERVLGGPRNAEALAYCRRNIGKEEETAWTSKLATEAGALWRAGADGRLTPRLV